MQGERKRKFYLPEFIRYPQTLPDARAESGSGGLVWCTCGILVPSPFIWQVALAELGDGLITHNPIKGVFFLVHCTVPSPFTVSRYFWRG